MEAGLSDKSKQYSAIKYSLSLIDTVYLIVLLAIFLSTGLSIRLGALINKLMPAYLVMPAYLFVIFIAYYILDFPLTIYRSFLLEHKFSLTKQKLSDWFMEQFKSGVVAYIIGIILLSVFYYILGRSPGMWWLIVSVCWIFFSLILAKLTPLIIIPLFFKYKPYSDMAVKARITALAKKMRIKILDVFEIDFSKKTLKANAAFVGWGNSRRVLLADTLKDRYSADEIEAILAHEFAHYKLKHLLK